ncbi:transcription factor SPT20 homolog isoform X2 [Neocloeon triangulifer]|uniref:transcription factor SPT20 homolog isoform X2 n=1 Tax=Neocloeon triangulifer TaxID=2078957 RepID=UPI00286F1B23|nr:transcription factor SPT20 homolog isoform X2 [Neocloeon triangulifer]
MQGLACEQAESYGYPQYYHASPGSSGDSSSASSDSCASSQQPALLHSVDQRLQQLCKEESASKKPCPSRLLKKLVAREGLGTLLVRLFPGDQGYKVSINSPGRTSAYPFDDSKVSPTIVSTYEEDELLPYIDREELPPAIADLLEDSPVPLFYAGCVVAEIMDMRHCPAGHNRFVLLKPSDQSLLCDINQLTSEGNWTNQEKLEIESQLILATQGPLCLDPSPSVAVHNTRARYQGLGLSSPPLRRLVRKYSQAAINKRRRLSQYLNSCSTPLLRFLDKRPRARPTQPLKLPPQMVNGHVEPPDPSEVLRLGIKACEEPPQSSECLPQLVEEYILQTERAQGRVYHIKLSLMQRPSTTEYFGELYVDRDFKEGHRNGASCRFSLGTQWHAKKYIDQFCEIFTEEGRKLVTITHIVPGKTPSVTNTWEKKEEENKVEEMAINPLLMHKPTALNNPILGVPAQMVQQQQQQMARVQTSPTKVTSPTRHNNATNAAISALATSLMNSAQQFQQQAAANANAAVPQQVAQKGRRQSNTLLTARLNAPVQQITPQASPQQSLLSPQPARMSALTSQLNAPPVIAPAQPFVNFSYSVPNKMVATLRPTMATFAQNSQQQRQPSPQQVSQQSPQPPQVQIQAAQETNLGMAMPGLSALLAGTPSADNPMPGSTNNLLERLTSPTIVPAYVAPAPTPPSPVATSQSPKPITQSPMSSPSTLSVSSVSNLNLHIASLQEAMARVPAFQNVQETEIMDAWEFVSIPGLPNPISLSLNVSQNAVQPSGVIVPTLPIANTATLTSPSVVAPAPTPQPITTQLGTLNVSPANHTMLLTANTMAGTGQVLSLPVAQVMTPAGVKTALGQGLRPNPTSPMAIPQLTQASAQQIQLLGALPGQVQRRGIVQRSPTHTTTLKLQSQTPQTSLQATLGQPVVTLATQQQLQLALQKHPQLQQCLNQQKVNVKPPRRSSAAEPK